MSHNKFSKVGGALWHSKRYRGLPDDQSRLLYHYFLTSEHQCSIGCYVLPDGYALHDLQWDLKTYSAARQALIDAELILFDFDTTEIYVRRWFQHNPPTNSKHEQGCLRLIGDIESEAISERVAVEFDEAVTKVVAKQQPAEPTPARMGSGPYPISDTVREFARYGRRG